MEYIKIPSENGNYVVPVCNIIRVQSIDNYSKVYFTDDKPLVVAKLLLWFEERLPASSFTRIHRSHIVNGFFVTGYQQAGTAPALYLSNGEMIAISRRRQSMVRKLMALPAEYPVVKSFQPGISEV